MIERFSDVFSGSEGRPAGARAAWPGRPPGGDPPVAYRRDPRRPRGGAPADRGRGKLPDRRPEDELPEGAPPDRNRLHDRDKDRFTPFIVLRYDSGDTGARALAPGTIFWHSPDVWVVSSAGVNVPVAGEANKVFARVNNWGLKDATPVEVRFWWANPSLAITEAFAHPIGTATGVFVTAGASVIVECPDAWVPVIENNTVS